MKFLESDPFDRFVSLCIVCFGVVLLICDLILASCANQGLQGFLFLYRYQDLLLICFLIPECAVIILCLLMRDNTTTSGFIRTLIEISVFIAIPFISLTQLQSQISKGARTYYDTQNIICVYADHGSAQKADVCFRIDDETQKSVQITTEADRLGYDNVKTDDSISVPEDRLEPSGKTLVIPKSYLKESKK